jgi:hypothetical protein
MESTVVSRMTPRPIGAWYLLPWVSEMRRCMSETCFGGVVKPAQWCEFHYCSASWCKAMRCMCCKTMRCMCCETTRCMCCKTMSGRHTEEHMSCNSERVVVPRSLTECISAEKNCSCIHPNHRNGNMWHLFLPPYKSQKPLHVTPFPLSLQSEETVTCDTFSLVPPNPRNRYMWHLFVFFSTSQKL